MRPCHGLKRVSPVCLATLASVLATAFVATPAWADAPTAEGQPAAAAPDAAPAAVPPVASPVAPTADAPAPRRQVASLSHALQPGLAILIGDGYRGIFPYKDGLFCGDGKAGDSARVCTNRAPVFMDFQPSFGISESWDVLVDFRYSLQSDFSKSHQFLLMPGFRYWLDPQSHVKFFTTIQLAYDRSEQNNPLVGNTDIGVRNSNGLMIEVMRNFGVYFQFGETIGFVRWLSFAVDGGIGIQARVN